jgi:hypothetical protein
VKSSVKAPLARDFARLRLHALTALGGLSGAATACKTSASTEGLVVAPMLDTPVVASATTAEPDASAAPVAHRPTVDPRPPRGRTCARQVECLAPMRSPPPWPYAHPYERCDPNPIGEIGRFSPSETAAHRATEPNTCCYVGFVSCGVHAPVRPMLGRPLRNPAGGAIVARTRRRGGWALADASGERDDARAAFWAESGAAEHSSIAEFARLSLVLLGLGAPADLVADVHRAALDEIAHAETCFALASRFAGRPVGPGPLAVAAATADASIDALVDSTLRDGCVGEAAGALDLAAVARAEDDAGRRAAIAAMGRDEERHAALAWRILGFALRREPETARAAVARFLDDPRPRNALERRVLDEVVRPCLRSLTSCGTLRSPREGDCERGA